MNNNFKEILHNELIRHECELSKKYGAKVDRFLDSKWWVQMGDYTILPIWFCPYCGVKLEYE